jgi:anti-anti-sigma factor
MSEKNGGDLLEREDIGDMTVFRVNAPTLRDDLITEDVFQHLFTVVDEGKRLKVVLNLSAIQYFASAALGKLVVLTRKARVANVRLVLCNVTPNVEQALQITRLADLMIVYHDEQEARRSFG